MLDMLVPEIRPGITTTTSTHRVRVRMDHDARPATLMYRGYTKSTCTSINHVVCHGIPTTSRSRKATSSMWT